MNHTNTHHRHAVAAPIALGMILTGFLTSSLPSQAFQEVKPIAEAIVVQPQEDAQLVTQGDARVLFQGTAFVSGPSVISFKAGASELKGLSGGFSVSLRDDQLTVVALSSPVLVTLGSQKLIVPVGRQWHGGSVLASLRDGWQAWAEARETFAIPAQYFQESLQKLPASSATFDCLTIISELSDDADTWLLTQFQPDCRDFAWKQPVPQGTTREQLALKFIFFPQSDLLATDAGDALRRRFQLGIPEFLTVEGDVDGFLSLVTRELQHAVDQHAERHHPLREEAYGHLLEQLERRYGTVHISDPDQTDTTPVTAKPEEPACDASVMSQADLEAFTEQWLKKLHALSTIHTKIDFLESGRVSVESIALPGNASDHLYSFEILPACKRVEKITQDEVLLPYSLSVEQFEEWVGE